MEYSKLLTYNTQKLAESPKSYLAFTERHLQAVWFEQKYFKSLSTTEGDPITIISPGLWNGDAGPDFKKAHIIIGNKEIRGDIEIHLSDEGWTQHQHHTDPRYQDVVLHVSLWKPKNPKQIKNLHGTPIAQTYIEPTLTIPLTRIIKLIDLDLYPYKTHSGSGQCAQTLFRKLPKEKISQFFRSAAAWRLKQKYIYLKENAQNPQDVLPLGIAMALGYKNNTQAFLEIYHYLKGFPDLTEKELFALSLGSCGFFSDYFQKKWKDTPYYLELSTTFKTLQNRSKQSFKLHLNQIRPYNHPVRRLAFLTKMLRDPSIKTLSDQMLMLWTPSLNWAELRKSLEDSLPSYEDPFWNHHYSFHLKPTPEPLPLLGQSLRQQIIVNTFLPILSAHINEKKDLYESEAFQEFYASFPGGDTGKKKYLKQRFFGDSVKGKGLSSAYMEQGAYQLHHDFCVHYEASCEGCPFVERYKTIFCFN